MRTIPQIAMMLILTLTCSAEIVDQIVAIIGGQAVKRSDILREVRLTSFLNGGPVPNTVAAYKESVERLVDQAIIRSEIANGMYEVADPAQAEAMFRQVQTDRGGAAGLQRALESYGLTEPLLREYLQWQTQVLRFVELRFGTGSSEEGPANDQFFAWLDQMRRVERVEIREDRLR